MYVCTKSQRQRLQLPKVTAGDRPLRFLFDCIPLSFIHLFAFLTQGFGSERSSFRMTYSGFNEPGSNFLRQALFSDEMTPNHKCLLMRDIYGA